MVPPEFPPRKPLWTLKPDNGGYRRLLPPTDVERRSSGTTSAWLPYDLAPTDRSLDGRKHILLPIKAFFSGYYTVFTFYCQAPFCKEIKRRITSDPSKMNKLPCFFLCDVRKAPHRSFPRRQAAELGLETRLSPPVTAPVASRTASVASSTALAAPSAMSSITFPASSTAF